MNKQFFQSIYYEQLSQCPECRSTDLRFFEARILYCCNQYSFSNIVKRTKQFKIFLYNHWYWLLGIFPTFFLEIY